MILVQMATGIPASVLWVARAITYPKPVAIPASKLRSAADRMALESESFPVR